MAAQKQHIFAMGGGPPMKQEPNQNVLKMFFWYEKNVVRVYGMYVSLKNAQSLNDFQVCFRLETCEIFKLN